MDFSINEVKKQAEHSKLIFKEEVKIIERENESLARNFVTSNDMNVMGNQIKKEFVDELKKIKEEVEVLEKEKSNLLKYDNFKRELTN